MTWFLLLSLGAEEADRWVLGSTTWFLSDVVWMARYIAWGLYILQPEHAVVSSVK